MLCTIMFQVRYTSLTRGDRLILKFAAILQNDWGTTKLSKEREIEKMDEIKYEDCLNLDLDLVAEAETAIDEVKASGALENTLQFANACSLLSIAKSFEMIADRLVGQNAYIMDGLAKKLMRENGE